MSKKSKTETKKKHKNKEDDITKNKTSHKSKNESKKKKHNSSKTEKSKDKSKKKSHQKSKKEVNKKKKNGIQLSSGQTKLLRIIWNIIFYAGMLLIIVGSLFAAISQQNDKSLYGYRMFGVLTDSMVSPDNTIKKGGFRSGDILITKEVKPEDVKVGDVITYKLSINPKHSKDSSYLTHRVIKIENGRDNEKGLFFTTQGDANKTEDMPISEKALIGKEVAVIPKLGGLVSFVKDNVIVSFIFIFSVLGFIWILKTYIFIDYTDTKSSKSTKKKSKK